MVAELEPPVAMASDNAGWVAIAEASFEAGPSPVELVAVTL